MKGITDSDDEDPNGEHIVQVEVCDDDKALVGGDMGIEIGNRTTEVTSPRVNGFIPLVTSIIPPETNVGVSTSVTAPLGTRMSPQVALEAIHQIF